MPLAKMATALFSQPVVYNLVNSIGHSADAFVQLTEILREDEAHGSTRMHAMHVALHCCKKKINSLQTTLKILDYVLELEMSNPCISEWSMRQFIDDCCLLRPSLLPVYSLIVHSHSKNTDYLNVLMALCNGRIKSVNAIRSREQLILAGATKWLGGLHKEQLRILYQFTDVVVPPSSVWCLWRSKRVARSLFGQNSASYENAIVDGEAEVECARATLMKETRLPEDIIKMIVNQM
jgi:hypothetical protein